MDHSIDFAGMKMEDFEVLEMFEGFEESRSVLVNIGKPSEVDVEICEGF